MKKLSKLAVILTALALALALAACSHPNSGDDSSGSQAATYLDGTYRMTVAGHGIHYLFLPDGTIEVNTGFHGDNEGSGTYTISGNTLSGNGNEGENTVTFTGRKDSDGKWFVTYTVSFANGDPDFISEEFELIRQ